MGPLDVLAGSEGAVGTGKMGQWVNGPHSPIQSSMGPSGPMGNGPPLNLPCAHNFIIPLLMTPLEATRMITKVHALKAHGHGTWGMGPWGHGP